MDLGTRGNGSEAATSLWELATTIIQHPQLPKKMHQMQPQLRLLLALDILVLA